MTTASVGPLHTLVSDARVVVCVGSGGVGKTTTAALVGMHAALQGRRVLVMTVDPARRLANALGLSELRDDIQQIDLTVFEDPAQPSGGALFATMLDMKRAFDDIVARHAADDATREAILNNRYYRFFSTSLAGAQELSASERLHEVWASGAWDLIVLDTPPTANALDFLDAPVRFFDALDSAALQWAVQAGAMAARGSAGFLQFGTQLITRTLGRFTGREFFEELGTFLHHFSALFDGFRDRARATAALFAADHTQFIIVTSPDPLTVEEALYFRERLGAFSVHLGAVVVNRVRQPFSSNRFVQDEPALVDALLAQDGARLIGRALLERLARKLIRNATELDGLAQRDAAVVAQLRQRVPGVPLVQAPQYAADVHSLQGLDRMRRALMDDPGVG